MPIDDNAWGLREQQWVGYRLSRSPWGCRRRRSRWRNRNGRLRSGRLCSGRLCTGGSATGGGSGGSDHVTGGSAGNGGSEGSAKGGSGGVGGAGGGAGGAHTGGSSGSSGGAGAGNGGGLPWLTVNGNKLQDPTGKTIILRGSALIDIGSLYWYGGQSAAGITARMDKVAAAGVQGHVVRLPVYPEDRLQHGRRSHLLPLPLPGRHGPDRQLHAEVAALGR